MSLTALKCPVVHYPVLIGMVPKHAAPATGNIPTSIPETSQHSLDGKRKEVVLLGCVLHQICTMLLYRQLYASEACRLWGKYHFA